MALQDTDLLIIGRSNTSYNTSFLSLKTGLDSRYLQLSGNNTVSNFKIKGPNTAGNGESTFLNISSGYLNLYHVQTPSSSDTEWAANVQYVNNATNGLATETYVTNAISGIDLSGYATETYVSNSLSSYLPLAGGTMTGKITSNYGNNSRVDFRSNGTSPNADIAYNGNWKVSIQSDRVKLSQQLDLFSHKIINVTDPVNNQDAATKKYVDDNSGKVTVGTASNPTLASGELYWNTSKKVLYIGN